MINELWAEIAGSNGFYQVSNFGNIRSVDRVIVRKNGKIQTFKARLLKTGKCPDGYSRIALNVNGKRIYVIIHREIAKNWIANPDNYPCVNHINGIKGDNRIENLEWCSYSYNNSHAYRSGLKSNKGAKCSRARKVENILTGEIFGCAKDAGHILGINKNTIYKQLNGHHKNKTSLKYVD